MNQSSYIAAFLLAGFVLFLAANNRLSEYAAVLWGSPAPPPGGKSAPASSRSSDAGAPTSSQPFVIGGGLITSPNTTVVNLDPAINSAIGTVLGTVAGWFGL